MKPDAEGCYLIPIFNGQESTSGHRYDNIAKAIRESFNRGPIPVCLGLTSPDEDKYKYIDENRVCGFISEPRFLEESEIIQGLFKPSPKEAPFIESLLAPQPLSCSIRQGNPRFGIRGHVSLDADGNTKLEKIISIDMLTE